MKEIKMRSNILIDFEAMCYNALVEEVITTPKPGLVDLASSGAHNDMSLMTFINSAKAIVPFLGSMAEYTYFTRDSMQGMFTKVQAIGIEAEHAMYEATKGINTHKGAIFSMGIIVAAAGCVLSRQQEYNCTNLFETAKALCSVHISNYLSEIKSLNTPTSNGEKLYCLMGIPGVRGEAQRGFPSVREFGLPVLKEMIKEGFSYNDAKLQALMVLMSKVDDTTVISRVGIDGLRVMQSTIKNLLHEGGVRKVENIERLYWLDEVFMQDNISAGGCADLLGLTILINNIEMHFSNKYSNFSVL